MVFFRFFGVLKGRRAVYFGRYDFCCHYWQVMKKVLVIDDEEWLREMIHLALRQRGFEVIESPNGSDGIEKARKELSTRRAAIEAKLKEVSPPTIRGTE